MATTGNNSKWLHINSILSPMLPSIFSSIWSSINFPSFGIFGLHQAEDKRSLWVQDQPPYRPMTTRAPCSFLLWSFLGGGGGGYAALSNCTMHPVPQMEFFLNRMELSVNSGNLVNHWSMNWGQFKDPLSYMCLSDTEVACCPLTIEVADWNTVALFNKSFCKF